MQQQAMQVFGRDEPVGGAFAEWELGRVSGRLFESMGLSL